MCSTTVGLLKCKRMAMATCVCRHQAYTVCDQMAPPPFLVVPGIIYETSNPRTGIESSPQSLY